MLGLLSGNKARNKELDAGKKQMLLGDRCSLSLFFADLTGRLLPQRILERGKALTFWFA